MKRVAVLLILMPVASPAAATLPDPVRAMIEAAFRDNDPSAIAAVLKLAKETYPEDAAEVDAMNSARAQRLALAQKTQREEGHFLDFVHGSVELGFSRTTGDYESVGAYGAVQVTQTSPHWQHSLSLRADYLRQGGITSTDRIVAAYQPDYKLNGRTYLYGLAEYERDPIIGYWSRLTGGFGLGYTVINKPGLRVDLTGGPAIRHTDFIRGAVDEPANTPNEATSLAGRASLSTQWKLSPTFTFTQDAAAYVERGDEDATADFGLETPLIGKLKIKLSYSLQYESEPPTGLRPLDTISRATLDYNF